MKRSHCRNAFTLIEVLIVVIIMAVLAATIIPQFSASTEDAKASSLDFNLHTMQTQLELYKLHHLGTLPTITDFVDQMTKATNASGGFTGDTPYGPYIQGEIPYNPFNNSNTVVAVATEGTEPSAVVGGGTDGWQYDQSTGRIFPNNAEYYE